MFKEVPNYSLEIDFEKKRKAFPYEKSTFSYGNTHTSFPLKSLQLTCLRFDTLLSHITGPYTHRWCSSYVTPLLHSLRHTLPHLRSRLCCCITFGDIITLQTLKSPYQRYINLQYLFSERVVSSTCATCARAYEVAAQWQAGCTSSYVLFVDIECGPTKSPANYFYLFI